MGRKKTGSVYTKDGVLWYAFTLRSGKRYAKRVPPLPGGGVATEPQARTYLAEALRRYELGLWDPEAPASSAPTTASTTLAYTVSEFAERWYAALPHASKFNEEIVLRKYLTPTDLGRMKLTDVAPHHMTAWVRWLRAQPSSKGGTLAPQTVRAFWGVVKRMFIAAVYERLVPATPCVLLPGTLPVGHDKVPGARKKWRFTREEAEAFISDPRVPPERRMLWALLLCAGLRAGESSALRWRDWDPKRAPLGCLTVERAWSSRHRVEKSTKTKASREVPVHPTLAAILAEWKLSGWSAFRGDPSKAPGPDDLIVPNERGVPRQAANTHDSMRVDMKHLGIDVRRLHGMRHAFISLAIDGGARPDVISKVTHTRPQTSSFDAYREESWETLCAEVAKIRINRQPDVLPLWKAASAAGGSATDSATDGGVMNGNDFAHDVSRETESDHLDDLVLHERSHRTRFPANPPSDRVSRVNHPALSDTGSATDSATNAGPLTGELWAQDWFERALLEGEP